MSPLLLAAVAASFLAQGEFSPPKAGQEFVVAAGALRAKLGPAGEKSQVPAPNDPAVMAYEAQASKAIDAL